MSHSRDTRRKQKEKRFISAVPRSRETRLRRRGCKHTSVRAVPGDSLVDIKRDIARRLAPGEGRTDSRVDGAPGRARRDTEPLAGSRAPVASPHTSWMCAPAATARDCRCPTHRAEHISRDTPSSGNWRRRRRSGETSLFRP